LVYRLETTAGASLIVAKGDNLELRPGRLEVDSLEFASVAQHVLGSQPSAASVDIETLQAWVELASQPLLQDLDSLSEAFESWRRARRIDHDQLLGRLLRYMAQWQGFSGDAAAALGTAEKLIRLDPYSEPAYVLMMQLHATQRSVSGVEATYMRCADVLRAEFGIRPSPTTDQAYLALLRTAKELSGPAALGEEAPSLRFATSARSTVAYATLGQGPRVLVVMPSFRSHIEIAWEDPNLRRAFQTLATRFKVVMFDRPGSGLSERMGASGTSEAAAADVLAILDHAGIDRACLFATSDSGPTAIRIAAQNPERVGNRRVGAVSRGGSEGACVVVAHGAAVSVACKSSRRGRRPARHRCAAPVGANQSADHRDASQRRSRLSIRRWRIHRAAHSEREAGAARGRGPLVVARRSRRGASTRS